MVTISLELPDELARRLIPLQNRLPEIIELGLRQLDLEPEEDVPDSYATRQQVLQVIKESGLYEPLGPAWDKFSLDAPELSYAELRQQVGALSPPLSETIIEDRGPR